MVGSPGGEASLVEGKDGGDLSQGARGSAASVPITGETPPVDQRLDQGNLGGDSASEIGLQVVLVEALESVATFGFCGEEVRGDSRVQNEDGAGSERVGIGGASDMRSRVVGRRDGSVTGHQRGDVVTKDTGSGGVAPGLRREADGVRVSDVIPEEEDAEVIERSRVQRIGREDRRGVTDIDVVNVSIELESHHDG